MRGGPRDVMLQPGTSYRRDAEGFSFGCDRRGEERQHEQAHHVIDYRGTKDYRALSGRHLPCIHQGSSGYGNACGGQCAA